jgi:hypothetical protein
MVVTIQVEVQLGFVGPPTEDTVSLEREVLNLRLTTEEDRLQFLVFTGIENRIHQFVEIRGNLQSENKASEQCTHFVRNSILSFQIWFAHELVSYFHSNEMQTSKHSHYSR